MIKKIAPLFFFSFFLSATILVACITEIKYDPSNMGGIGIPIFAILLFLFIYSCNFILSILAFILLKNSRIVILDFTLSSIQVISFA
jgi:hypothetical protein